MNVYSKVIKNTYYDSVVLMLISKEIKEIEDIENVIVAMGTDMNINLAKSLSIYTEELEDISSNDLFISFSSKEDVFNKVIDKVDELLNKKAKTANDTYHHKTLLTEIKNNPSSNLVFISVAGEYAYEQAKIAIDNNKNVMMFSDNVSVEHERKLKELAVSKGLLMMGPDCGTCIINNKPLGFSNSVRKGPIGIIGSSGTGIQEVSVLIDYLGSGVSQVIGTGGRDMKKEIGGLTTIQSLKLLLEDKKTEVIVIISKKPDEEVIKKVLALVKLTSKKILVSFIDSSPELVESYNVKYTSSLEEAAYVAVSYIDKNIFYEELEYDIKGLINDESKRHNNNQNNLLGLFVGGTLATEADRIIRKDNVLYSNVYKSEYFVNKLEKNKNIILDLGDDEFTNGKAHPMIDPSFRTSLIKSIDESVMVLIFDIVLGYGSHEDPVSELLPSLKEVMLRFINNDSFLTVITSICGSETDYQDYLSSKERLEDIGVIVLRSNRQVADLANRLLNVKKHKNLDKIFNSDLSVISLGIDTFYNEMKDSDINVSKVNWRPTANGNKKMRDLLAKLKE